MKTSTLAYCATVGLLLLAGLLFIFDASSSESYNMFGTIFYFFWKQAAWIVLGVISALIVSKIPITFIEKLSKPVFFASLALLFLVFIPGIGHSANGAARWIRLGPMVLQPAEVCKLALTLYFAAWLHKSQDIFMFLMNTGLVAILFILQPDLGSALILCSIAFSQFFIAGARTRDVAAILGIGVLGVVCIIMLSGERMSRISTFLYPERDPTGAGYQVRQITLAFGSGRVFGKGFGQSRQKYRYIPEASTDSIIAIIGEDVGFLGSTVVLLLYISLILQGYRIAQKAQGYDQLVAVGLTTWLAAQTFLNIASATASIPFTGVPLPFISYGGSSLVTLLASSGIMVGIMQRKTQ